MKNIQTQNANVTRNTETFPTKVKETRKSYTRQVRDRLIIKYYQKGYKGKHLAQLYQVSSIYPILKRHGVPANRNDIL